MMVKLNIMLIARRFEGVCVNYRNMQIILSIQVYRIFYFSCEILKAYIVNKRCKL